MRDLGRNVDHIVRGDAIAFVITGRCSKDEIGRNIIRRDWFECNKVQIWFSDKLGF
jgi:hypothetical protein